MKKTAGYSSTPLARKLGFKADHQYLLVGEPNHYQALFSDWPESAVTAETPMAGSFDFIHLFATQRQFLTEELGRLKPLLKTTGLIWVSWPKGKSAIPTEINREDVREIGLACGLVDVKVCAVDEDWSGLKFVYRLKDRK